VSTVAALHEGVNELAGERLNSPPKLGGVPARPSSSTKGRAGGVVPKQVVARFYLGTTPSAPALVASRHFINGAATPPNLGGELSRLPIHSQHPLLSQEGNTLASKYSKDPTINFRNRLQLCPTSVKSGAPKSTKNLADSGCALRLSQGRCHAQTNS